MSFGLAQALRLSSSSTAAFIGAGGKTSAIYQVARQLPGPVLITATSHLGIWQVGLADRHIIADTPEPLEALEHGVQGVVLVTGQVDADRTRPINRQVLNWLQQFCGDHSIPLLVEADGSREKPLKAWADHEPPVPSFAELVVQVVGLSGLNKPLSDAHVHRAEIFSRWSGLRTGELITPQALCRVLTHPESGLKNIPAGARRVALLNQAETQELQSAARGLVSSLSTAYDSVIVASLMRQEIYAVHEPVAGIILAAGGSTRYGQPKQLLDWKGQPFVRAIARTAVDAGLSPVVLVTGAHAEKVAEAVRGLPVIVATNESWQGGQGNSIKTGLAALGAGDSLRAQYVGGAIFLLADQPQVTTSILHALSEKHAEGLYPIVAPLVMDQRANPVLFDRATFPDLLSLEGDVGGRAIFHRHKVEYLPWHDDRLLLDVDTPEMYQRLISDETL